MISQQGIVLWDIEYDIPAGDITTMGYRIGIVLICIKWRSMLADSKIDKTKVLISDRINLSNVKLSFDLAEFIVLNI